MLGKLEKIRCMAFLGTFTEHSLIFMLLLCLSPGYNFSPFDSSYTADWKLLINKSTAYQVHIKCKFPNRQEIYCVKMYVYKKYFY